MQGVAQRLGQWRTPACDSACQRATGHRQHRMQQQQHQQKHVAATWFTLLPPTNLASPASSRPASGRQPDVSRRQHQRLWCRCGPLSACTAVPAGSGSRSGPIACGTSCGALLPVAAGRATAHSTEGQRPAAESSANHPLRQTRTRISAAAGSTSMPATADARVALCSRHHTPAADRCMRPGILQSHAITGNKDGCSKS